MRRIECATSPGSRVRAINKQAAPTAPPPETKMAFAFRQSYASWLTRGFLPAGVAAIACWHRRLSRHSAPINASWEGGRNRCQTLDWRSQARANTEDECFLLTTLGPTVSSTCYCDIWRASAYLLLCPMLQ